MHLMFCIFIPLKVYRCPQLLWTSVITCLESQRSFRRHWTIWLVLWKHTDVHNFGFLSCISHQAACFKVFCGDLSSTEFRSFHLLLLIRSLNSRFWAGWHRSCLRNLYCGRLHIGWVRLAAAVNLFCWFVLLLDNRDDTFLPFSVTHPCTTSPGKQFYCNETVPLTAGWCIENVSIQIYIFWVFPHSFDKECRIYCLSLEGCWSICACQSYKLLDFWAMWKGRSSEQGESATTFLWDIRIFWSFFLS
jgi:hypothetical protein